MATTEHISIEMRYKSWREQRVWSLQDESSLLTINSSFTLMRG